MPTITVQLSSAVRRTFRVEQIAGMFDVPIGERVKHELTAELPGLDEPWTIGAIVGPSGSGKTTLAKAAFGDVMHRRKPWPRNKALIDCFGDVGIKQLTLGLTSVGLGSPPSWLKPYHALSMGERFRADLIKSVLSVGLGQVVVVDEFSSLLDRTIAKTASAAIARLIRYVPDELRSRLVVVTCHRDVLPWLGPDWILELGQKGVAPRLIRERPRKPSFRFTIERVRQALWTRFSGEHYLAGGLAASATCYAAFWRSGRVVRQAEDVGGRECLTHEHGRQECLPHEHGRQECLPHGEPIAFCAVVAVLGCRGMKRIQRLVTLPEFQGLGIGGKLLDAVAEMEFGRGFRVTITASHPAVIAHCSRSPRWRYLAVKKTGSTPQQFDGRAVPTSSGRAVAAFEWGGEGGRRRVERD